MSRSRELCERQLESVMDVAGMTEQEMQNPRIRKAFRLFLRATEVKDMSQLANDILELRRGER
jgi:hypothetical protein